MSEVPRDEGEARYANSTPVSAMALENILILHDADLDLVVEVCVRERLLNAGQSCIAAKRFIVVAPVREESERKFTARMAAVRVGEQGERGLSPMATLRGRENLHAQVLASLA